MAHVARLLQPIRFRASLFRITLNTRVQFYGNLPPLKSWMKGLQPPVLRILPSSSHLKFYLQRYLRMPNICYSGRKLIMGSIFGVSLVLGSISLWPRVSYSMDDFDMLLDDHRVGLLGASNSEEHPHIFSTFAKKMLVPVFLFSIVLMNWGHPIILVAKIILILLSTKPSPFSVYLYIEQLRRQSMCQHPILYKFKSLYAKKVEVEDYTFLCVARVELEDQKLTVIGILGSWWAFQLPAGQGAFSELRNRALNYIRS